MECKHVKSTKLDLTKGRRYLFQTKNDGLWMFFVRGHKEEIYFGRYFDDYLRKQEYCHRCKRWESCHYPLNKWINLDPSYRGECIASIIFNRNWTPTEPDMWNQLAEFVTSYLGESDKPENWLGYPRWMQDYNPTQRMRTIEHYAATKTLAKLRQRQGVLQSQIARGHEIIQHRISKTTHMAPSTSSSLSDETIRKGIDSLQAQFDMTSAAVNRQHFPFEITTWDGIIDLTKI